MPNSESSEQYPLRHYNENWWHIDGKPIWYLAGPHLVPGEEFTPGKWYFENEVDMFTGPYDTLKECEDALNNHSANL